MRLLGNRILIKKEQTEQNGLILSLEQDTDNAVIYQLGTGVLLPNGKYRDFAVSLSDRVILREGAGVPWLDTGLYLIKEEDILGIWHD
jgi:co-chaperonin GroES (HSP10)